MDPQQQKAFEEAVERKKAEAQEASEAPVSQTPGTGKVDGPQDTGDGPRDSSTRHDQVTADKWNQ
jgi:hypothetical protein